jgi:hypothetical protein
MPRSPPPRRARTGRRDGGCSRAGQVAGRWAGPLRYGPSGRITVRWPSRVTTQTSRAPACR